MTSGFISQPQKYYIIGNWKSHKTVEQAEKWLEDYYQIINNINLSKTENPEVIICVAYIHLFPLKKKITEAKKKWPQINAPLKLAAQNVSPFSQGAYTGEISADMMQGLVDYCLVGHSERREKFAETNEVIFNKVKQLNSAGIKPILCVPDVTTPIPSDVELIAYEPVWAIGSGKPATPEHANQVARQIKMKHKRAQVIYGGSVNPDNVASFISQSEISGVLPGGASLKADTFIKIIANAKGKE